MAGSDKITHRVDAGGNSAQSAESLSEAASGKAADGASKSIKDQDAEWGYESGRGGMATEAKMGMCIVLILGCAFAFLVYNKFDLKQRALDLANANKTQVEETEPGNENTDPYAEFEPTSDTHQVTASLSTGAPVQEDPLAPGVAEQRSPATFQPEPQPKKQPETLTQMEPAIAFNDPLETAQQFDLQEPLELIEEVVTSEVKEILAADDTLISSAALAATPLASDESVSAFESMPREESSPPANDFAATPFSPEPIKTFEAFSDHSGDHEKAAELVASTEAPVQFDRTLPPADSVDQIPPTLEPAFGKPDFDEPAFAAFGAKTNSAEEEPIEAVASLPEPIASPAEPPVFKDLPPASDFDSESITEEPVVAESAGTNFATDEPKISDVLSPPKTPPTPDPFHSTQDDSGIAALGSTSVNAFTVTQDTNSVESTSPFSAFAAEPELAPRFDDSTPVRKAAPLPEFPMVDVTPAPSPLPQPQPQTIPHFETDPVRADDLRRDSFVAMSSPAPEVEVFDDPGFVTPPPQREPVPVPRDTFDTFEGFPKTPLPPPPNLAATPPPISSNTSAPTFAIPPTSDGAVPRDEGVAKFAIPADQGVKQVAAASTECDICEVKPNDNYWNISRRAYGTARYFSSLALFNRDRIPDPRKLKPGMKVLIPDPRLLEQKYPEFFKDQQKTAPQQRGYFVQPNGSPAYRIGERETLSAISQKHLGRASRWIQIYRMNQHILKDPNKLKPGTVIALPEDATNVRMAP